MDLGADGQIVIYHRHVESTYQSDWTFTIDTQSMGDGYFTTGIKYPADFLLHDTEYLITLDGLADLSTGGTSRNLYIAVATIVGTHVQYEDEKIVTIDGTYATKTVKLKTGKATWARFLTIRHEYKTDEFFWIDNVHIQNTDILTLTDETIDLGTEILSEMNYTPTFDMMKGWDHALMLKGRIYYLNPYVEKRYENFLLVSIIHSDNSFMWDIASFSNFRELERHDGNNSLGLELLPTTEILIVKQRSYEILHDDGLTGILREPITGVSCVTKDGVVNLGGLIIIPGVDEIYAFSSSGGVKPLLVKTIRDIYQAIENKNLLFAIRDRYNSYRLRIYDPEDKTEFLLPETGWVEEKRNLFPVIYREDFHSKLNFMATDGNIYGTLYALENIGYGRLYSTKFGQRL